MPTKCCVPGCNGQGGFKFPKNAERREKWLAAIKRANFQPNKYSTVCALHFTEADISKLSHYGVPYTNTILVRNAVPSEFPWTAATKKKRAPGSKQAPGAADGEEVVTICVEPSAILVDCTSAEAPTAAATQQRDNYVSKWTQTGNTCFSVNLFASDPESLRHFAGVEGHDRFLSVFNTLGNAVDRLVYRHFRVVGMGFEDQFFLTLVKLRRHSPDPELGRLFGVSRDFAANVWMTWLGFMYARWGEESGMWPDRDAVDFFAPHRFRDRFPATRALVEALASGDAVAKVPASVYCDGKLKPSEIRRDKRLASDRARVERIFAVKGTYKILQEPMTEPNEAQLSTRIVSVCFMLYNLRCQ